MNDSLSRPVLIMKTGTTIGSLLEQGEDFEQWFQSGLGLSQQRTQVVDVSRGESLPPVEDVSGVVITGSPAFVTDLAPWNFTARDFLLQAHESRLPILGICYGHQLLAWSFGGEVAFNSGGRAIGSVSVELHAKANADPLLRGLPTHIDVNLSHLQSVTALPNEAQLLARAGHDACHGFRLGDRTWGLQFHPEFDARITRAYISERRPQIVAEGLNADSLAQAVVETPESASILRRFADFIEARSN